MHLRYFSVEISGIRVGCKEESKVFVTYVRHTAKTRHNLRLNLKVKGQFVLKDNVVFNACFVSACQTQEYAGILVELLHFDESESAFNFGVDPLALAYHILVSHVDVYVLVRTSQDSLVFLSEEPTILGCSWLVRR